MIRKMAPLLLAASVLLLVSSCGKLDVEGNDAARAFGEVLTAWPPFGLGSEGGEGWKIKAPDEAADFRIQWDEQSDADYDLAIKADAAPFLNAGLDASLLPEGLLTDDSLLFRLDLDKTAPPDTTGALEVFEQIRLNHRAVLGYHSEFDHYNFDLGGGNMFEWARDMGTNDKDIVFVLDPAPFLNAGVRADEVAGWSLMKVPVEVNGQAQEVDKFVKAFDLVKEKQE